MPKREGVDIVWVARSDLFEMKELIVAMSIRGLEM